jgi:hypothetical protein
MGNSEYSFLKQWFTFTYSSDNTTDLIYSCTNNHYIHNWLKECGYTSFKNEIKVEDLDLLTTALNNSVNMIPDEFETNFPDEYISGYSLWNMDSIKYWSSSYEYTLHAKEQMSKLFEGLWEVEENIRQGVVGILEYHIYYSH